MKVVAGGNYALDPLYLEPMSSTLDLSQVWIFRQPDTNSNNPHFVIMSPKTELSWDLHNSDKTAGAYIQVYNTINENFPEQFLFYN